MATYLVEPTRDTLHGAFSRDRAPVLTVEPQDRVAFRTLDAGWATDGPEPSAPKFEAPGPERGDGHALCGQVAISGAEPGMMLEVQIGTIRPGPWGWSVAGGWDSPLNRRLGVVEGKRRHHWSFDHERRLGRNQYGHTVALRPFMGVMGMPPDEPGLIPTLAPRPQGGNLD